jgi:hypothetical protein
MSLWFVLFPLQMGFKQILGSPSICQLEENAEGTAGNQDCKETVTIP